MAITWSRTTAGSHYDFSAEENGEHVGRIYRHDGGPQDKTWFWTCTGCQRGVEAEGVRPLQGLTDTRDEAIAELMAAWGRAKAWGARTGLPLRP